MSDTREKLIELLDIIIQPGQKTLGEIADHFISNGVTVQEWIPVSERLPEINGRVLVYRPGMPFEIHVARYSESGWNRWDAIDDNTPHGAITHWMPLPELPKGE